ncbi:hypothetical protein C8R46DRAFT_1058874 [Mycena filopes]|nr:hypothetical protein C8R46DRAFT_1058874 [Mycena filopes]
MPSALATAGLVEVLLETFCCGIYAVLFTAVVYLFRIRHGILPSKKAARWTFLGLILQFLTILGHWIARIDDTFVGFVHLGGGAAADVRVYGEPSRRCLRFEIDRTASSVEEPVDDTQRWMGSIKRCVRDAVHLASTC